MHCSLSVILALGTTLDLLNLKLQFNKVPEAIHVLFKVAKSHMTVHPSGGPPWYFFFFLITQECDGSTHRLMRKDLRSYCYVGEKKSKSQINVTLYDLICVHIFF